MPAVLWTKTIRVPSGETLSEEASPSGRGISLDSCAWYSMGTASIKTGLEIRLSALGFT